jgi:isopenicillin-N N-acyltransferase like protein
MVSPFPCIDLKGTPAERGEAYGAAARKQIRKARDYYLKSWALSEAELGSRVKNFLPTLEAFACDLVEEMRGIAKGSDCTFDEVLAINARNEIMFGHRPVVEGCTILAATAPATANDDVYMAQNWDWLPALTDAPVILRIRSVNAPALLTFVDAGRVAMHGFNEAGLGLCGNYLETSSHRGKTGIPIPLLRRRLLGCESVEEAVALLDSTPLSTSSNFLLCDRSGNAVDCEVTPVTVYKSRKTEPVLVHTNHFRYAANAIRDDGLERVPDSKDRADRLESLLDPGNGKIDLDVLKTALADHRGYPSSICRHGDDGPQWQTLASHIIDLRRLTMHVAKGHPCESDYHAVAL